MYKEDLAFNNLHGWFTIYGQFRVKKPKNIDIS